MKRILLFTLLIISTVSYTQTASDTSYWRTKGNLTINFTQNYFSNWSAGGVNSMAGLPKLSYEAIYEKGKVKWGNWVNLALGYSLIGKQDVMKTDDIIELISSIGYKIGKNWHANFMGKFNSQFAKGYNYGVDSTNYISKFMAPGFLELGPGIDYTLPDWFFVNFSPATARFTFVNDQVLADAGSFGLDPAVVDENGVIVEHAKTTKFQFGAKLITGVNYEVFKNVVMGTRLELFSDYLYKPQNIIVNWKTLLKLKVNSWLNVNFDTELFYDDSYQFYDENGVPEGPKAQFKQSLLIGIGINF